MSKFKFEITAHAKEIIIEASSQEEAENIFFHQPEVYQFQFDFNLVLKTTAEEQVEIERYNQAREAWKVNVLSIQNGFHLKSERGGFTCLRTYYIYTNRHDKSIITITKDNLYDDDKGSDIVRGLWLDRLYRSYLKNEITFFE
jgi:hypothetical protein